MRKGKDVGKGGGGGIPQQKIVVCPTIFPSAGLPIFWKPRSCHTKGYLDPCWHAVTFTPLILGTEIHEENGISAFLAIISC